MSNFYLTLEAVPGSTIYDCADEAVAIANRLQVTVMFGFNSVKCMACPGDNPRKLADDQQEMQTHGDNKYMIARGRP